MSVYKSCIWAAAQVHMNYQVSISVVPVAISTMYKLCMSCNNISSSFPMSISQFRSTSRINYGIQFHPHHQSGTACVSAQVSFHQYQQYRYNYMSVVSADVQ